MGNAEQAEAETYYRRRRNAKVLRKLAMWCGIATLVLATGGLLSGEETIRYWAALPMVAGIFLGAAAFTQWATRYGQGEPDPYGHP